MHNSSTLLTYPDSVSKLSSGSHSLTRRNSESLAVDKRPSSSFLISQVNKFQSSPIKPNIKPTKRANSFFWKTDKKN